MISKILGKILVAINKGNDVFDVLGSEYTYSQIGEAFVNMSNFELLYYKDGKYIISDKGKAILDELIAFEKIEVLEYEKFR